MQDTDKSLFIWGYGYSAAALARQLLPQGYRLATTTRSEVRRKELRRLGIAAFDFDDPALADILPRYSAMLSTIAPTPQGDPVLRLWGDAIRHAAPAWFGLLSTTGVYGDHQGGWVDETTPTPSQGLEPRLQARLAAENAWSNVAGQGVLHTFRLAGIYGPGRSIVDDLLAHQARRLDKPGQYFSRIHVADIAGAIAYCLANPSPGLLNLADDKPVPSRELVEYAALRLRMEPPPLQDYATAELSPMARQFYSANRRVSNARLREMGYPLLYPTYREGIESLISLYQSLPKSQMA